ncbi:MAG: hypothetical protein NTZ46_06980 [Verrucomicrobia bacterium]|nr:hypothetical protein [Verrucomicrobiota bacterium]
MNLANTERRTLGADDPYRTIKRLIWVYFFLLIYEGALRKWILPGLANPLLIVRDPVVILIYILALNKGVFPESSFVGWTIGLGIVSFLLSLVTGVGNFVVSVYGLRTDFLHIPLIFLMQKVLNSEDVKQLCKWLLITAVPMAFLVMVQFKSDPNAWVNTGVGGGEGGQLDVGFGKIRPPGTFSFTNGLANYVSLVAACALYAILEKKYYPRWLLFLAIPSVILMVVISGSRATVSACAISIAFLVLICLRRPTYMGGSFKFVILALPGLWLVTNLSIFQEGIMVQTARFGESGGGVQHGIIERALGDYLEGIYAAADAPFFGYGLGIGTNAAAGLLSGQRGFGLAEGEWARVVKEGGPIFGMAFLLLRVSITFYLGWSALVSFRRRPPNPLGLLIFSSCALLVLSAQFGQPTALGFAVFGAGLCLASTNVILEYLPEESESLEPIRRRGKPGRSVFAEALHQ